MKSHNFILRYFTIFIFLITIKNSVAQQNCVRCYHQNYSIGTSPINFIQNGSFENHTCDHSESFCLPSFHDSCTIDNWTCTGGGLYTYSEIIDSTESTIVDGNFAPYFGNYWAYACSSVQWDTTCLTYSNCEYSGITAGYPFSEYNYGGDTGVSLEQTVNGLIIGNTYVLEFWAGGEHDGLQFTDRGIFAVDVGYGKHYLGCLPTIGTEIGTTYLIEFVANATSHVIKFTNWGHMCYHCTELILDDVKLYPEEYLPKNIPNCLIGVDDFEKNLNAKIYPSPFKNSLTISIDYAKSLEYSLYEITGRLIDQKNFTRSTEINTTHLSSGIYFIELSLNGTSVLRKKIIKE